MTHFRLFILALLLLLPVLALSQSVPANCSEPQYHELDFWLGDWDVFEVDTGKEDAHVRVERLLDNCVLHETYEDDAGLKGESFSIYDASRRVWHQTWVTNRGQLLVIEGGLQGDAIVLEGATRNADGGTTLVRGTWKPAAGGVRETAVKSVDGGKTWKTWFDLMFRRRHLSANNDEKDIAELDAQYQLAVKNNDVAVMNRILADDFILISSRGKAYTKSDLIEEARTGRMHYEHQEDTDKKVRIWGDTAVVTAKLWEKGTEDGKPFDYKLWFSDIYVRTSNGWQYVLGQAGSAVSEATK